MTTDKEIFEHIYEQPDAGWTKHNPPEELKKLINNDDIEQCRAIDIGCGEGFYSIYLAKLGFEVTGIDISAKAIKYAKQNAEKANVLVNFLEMDVNEVTQLNEQFDFVLEWSVLHHIKPQFRKKYIEDVSKLLRTGGKYLATCFNDENIELSENDDKHRVSPIGTNLYYSSVDELKELYKENFETIDMKLITLEGPPGLTHIYNYFFLEKKA